MERGTHRIQKVVGYSCKGAIIALCADPSKVLFLTSASTRGQKQQHQYKILLHLLSSPLRSSYVTLFFNCEVDETELLPHFVYEENEPET